MGYTVRVVEKGWGGGDAFLFVYFYFDGQGLQRGPFKPTDSGILISKDSNTKPIVWLILSKKDPCEVYITLMLHILV